MYILGRLNSLIWDGCLVFLLIFAGLLCTVRLKCIQLKMPLFLIKQRKSRNNGLSQLKTVCMSLGTAMGTGNITGVASALAVGGAGAVFWMWVSAFLGMALVYTENSLSVIYSDKHRRGPAAYLEKGVGSRKMAVFFSVMCMFASFGMGGMVQVNTFADNFSIVTDIPSVFTALCAFLLIYAVISGGAERIGKSAQFLLPAVTLLFMCTCFAVIFMHLNNVPKAFAAIFTNAFGLRQASGGILGTAVSVGIRRGIFSNEAGLGSSPILHSAAESDSPETQGIWSMFEVFFDTMICCTLTAVTLLCSSSDMSVNTAFSSVLGGYTPYVLTAEIAIFAFCTIIGWYYCGESAFIYLFGDGRKKLFALVFAAFASLGAVFGTDAVWLISDIFNGAMAFPNLFAVLILGNKLKEV